MRYYVTKNNSVHSAKISARVESLASRELAHGFDKFSVFKKFASDVRERKDSLMELLVHLNLKKKKVVGYGAIRSSQHNYSVLWNRHISHILHD